MPEITAERIERLKGQVPPGARPKHWEWIVDYLIGINTTEADRHVLGLMIADADAREAASRRPLDMTVSEEWLKRMADAEDGGCTSVGGLAAELGLLGSKPKDVPVGIVDALRAVIEVKRHIERAMGEYVQDTIDGLGNRGQSGDSR